MRLKKHKIVHAIKIIVLIIGSLGLLEAQSEDYLDDIIHYLSFDEENETSSLDEIYFIKEQLDNYLQRPLKINSATPYELGQFFLLNEIQISSLLNYRKRFGNIESIAELSYLLGFTPKIIQLIEPFITFEIESKMDQGNLISGKYQQHTLLWRSSFALQTAKGYRIPDSLKDTGVNHYEGNNQKHYLKYASIINRRLRFGIKAEKDAGEPFFRGANKAGFDFYSAYISITETGALKSTIVGDYQLKAGLGYAFSTISNHYQASSGMTDTRTYLLRPHTGAGETAYLRGVATTIQLNKLTIMPYFSYKKLDARIIDTIDNQPVFSSIYTDGLHNTTGSINNKNTLAETIYGSYQSYSSGILSLGVGINYTYLNGIPAIASSGTKKYATSNITIHTDYKIKWKDLMFFGEYFKRHASNNFIQGLEILPASWLTITTTYQNFNNQNYSIYQHTPGLAKAYVPFYGYHFSAVSSPYNRLSVNYIFDYFKEKQSGYQLVSAQQKTSQFFTLRYKATDDISVTARLKHVTYKEASTHHQMDADSSRQKAQYNIQVKYRFSENAEIKVILRQHAASFTEMKTGGQLLEMHAKYSPVNQPIAIKVGNYLFDVSDYDFRLYAYEPDVLYAFTSAILYKQGVKYYAMVQWNISDNIDVWLKYFAIKYTNLTSISSGLNEINGDKKSGIKVQCIWKF